MNRTVERTLAILKIIANSEHGITLQEIANQMDMAKSSAFAIVHTLLELNYISTVENNDKKYCLGVETFALGMKYANNQSLVQQCVIHLPGLAEKYNKTAFLGILNGSNVVYLYKYVAENARLATCSIGSSKPAHATALGKALIAFLPPKAQRTLIDNIELTSYTDQTISSKEGFIAQLEQIKKQGYATEFAELGHLTACCSVPILDSQGNAVAAISLADIAESNENYLQMANDLKAAAAEISKIVTYTQN